MLLTRLFKYSVFTSLTILLGQSNYSVNGFVRDDLNGEPISYANVFISNTSIGAATNRDGYFVISDIPSGSYEINVSMIGYAVYKETIELSDTSSTRIEVRLKKQVIQGSEILVTAERQKFERSMESSQISLDIREINSAPAFIEPDVFRTLQMLPGVQTTSDFSSALYVRGSTPDQNLIMLDGIVIYNPYHLGGIFSTFNTDAIKEADFHAGGFPARYGGRMGAILNVLNREGNANKITGMFNISLISSKGLLEGPLPKWKGMKGSWMISGRRTYFDSIINALMIPSGQIADGTDSYCEFIDFNGDGVDPQGNIFWELNPGDSQSLYIPDYVNRFIIDSDGNVEEIELDIFITDLINGNGFDGEPSIDSDGVLSFTMGDSYGIFNINGVIKSESENCELLFNVQIDI